MEVKNRQETEQDGVEDRCRGAGEEDSGPHTAPCLTRVGKVRLRVKEASRPGAIKTPAHLQEPKVEGHSEKLRKPNSLVTRQRSIFFLMRKFREIRPLFYAYHLQQGTQVPTQ